MSEPIDRIYCHACSREFLGHRPNVGESITCPRCAAIGYGTYDMNGESTIEWYE